MATTINTVSKLKHLALNTVLTLATLLVMAVLTELVLRATGRYVSHDIRTVTEREFRRVPGLFSPGQKKRIMRKPALPHTVTVNTLGLRGPETTVIPEKYRILMLGDSFVFGDYVNDNETLPALLDSALGDSFEVLNGGILGATITDETYYLHRLLALDPRMVVLVYSENDVTDLYTEPQLHVILENNRRVKSSGITGLAYRLLGETCLFNLVQKFRVKRLVKATHDRQRRETAVAAHTIKAPSDAGADPKLPEYVSLLCAMRDELTARGIPLVFAAFPSHYNIAGEHRHPTIPPLMDVLRTRGIEGLDLTDTLNATGLTKTELFLVPHDGHPSPLGYRTAAGAIARAVRERL